MAATVMTRLLVLRAANASEAPTLHALIEAHREEGHLLPRSLAELHAHASRFIVALRQCEIVGCGELAPLSPTVAEIRSLVVDRRARGAGVGAALVAELRQRARLEGFATLCAFTHAPDYFTHMGFSTVPRVAVPEKVQTDCINCPLLVGCRQYAVLQQLDESTSDAMATHLGRVEAES